MLLEMAGAGEFALKGAIELDVLRVSAREGEDVVIVDCEGEVGVGEGDGGG